ncbi:MAG: hypothetical protein KBG15_08815 [Kofleriaceae bacterium]|nr:hypothetical protein [Kofleriaceae bacterium]
MKVLIGLLFVGLLIVSNAQCSIDHRSDGLVCVTKSDCANGRECVDGYCVGGPTIDAPRIIDANPIDAKTCPARCNSCDAGTNTCNIVCTTNNCATKVVCPVGWDCAIACNDARSCTAGVECRGDQNCNVTCTGTDSCNNILCGDGKCTVACTGIGACDQVDCNDACACDVTCSGLGSCGGQINCPGSGSRCEAPIDGCLSSTAQCNTCR